MRIIADQCTGCMICLDYCPGQAIAIEEAESSKAYVDEELCFECGLCRRTAVCPVDAFVDSESVTSFPRVAREFFSNPNSSHQCTGIPGRGTEESKTNDVTGRIKKGQVGLCIEFGRPGLGCTFADIACMTTALKELGVEFEKRNPLTALMCLETGSFSGELLQQRLLSAIIEVRLTSEKLEEAIPLIKKVGQEINTVFSLGLICRFEKNGELPILNRLSRLEITHAPNAKINLGMGRPLVED